MEQNVTIKVVGMIITLFFTTWIRRKVQTLELKILTKHVLLPASLTAAISKNNKSSDFSWIIDTKPFNLSILFMGVRFREVPKLPKICIGEWVSHRVALSYFLENTDLYFKIVK